MKTTPNPDDAAPRTACSPHGTLAGRYRRLMVRRCGILIGLALAVLIAFATDVATGPAGLSWWHLWDSSAISHTILWDIRLPQAVLAVMVGGCLALAGAEMQTTLNNALASPFTLGITNAATLGAAITMVFDLSLPGLGASWSIPFYAFAAALACTLFIHALARRFGATAETVVLFGIAMVFVLNALLWLIQYVASADAVQQIVFWTMGSLGRASWSKAAVVASVLAVCITMSMGHVWSMTTLRAGEDQARSLGIAVERLRLIVLIRVSVLAAAAISFVGTIGFIGLVGPHLARLLVGEDHRFFLPASVLCGAVVLSLAATASKMIIPGLILPIGIVTALVGIPLFMALLMTQRRQG